LHFLAEKSGAPREAIGSPFDRHDFVEIGDLHGSEPDGPGSEKATGAVFILWLVGAF
jgi:hypothetical protein